MSEWIARILEQQFDIEPDQTIQVVHRLGIIASALLFAVVTTLVMSFSVFFVDTSLASLQAGDPAPRDIVAPPSPPSTTYVSEVLTEQGRQAAVTAVEDVYDNPEVGIARQQTQLARQILDYVNNVRRDPYGTQAQKIGDLQQIVALSLTEPIAVGLLEIEDDRWRAADEQIVNLLERVLQQPIRENDLSTTRTRLPNRVSVDFEPEEREIIATVVSDLVRPNTFANPEDTEMAREEASANFQPVERTFVAGQIVVVEGSIIQPADLEALRELGLLQATPQQRRQALLRTVIQSFMVSLTVLVTIGLFLSRFSSELFEQPRFLVLAAVLYILFLIGARIIGISQGEIYLYPTAAMALLFVAILGPEMAIVSSLGLALMVGFMIGQQLELTVLIALGGLIGTLTLRRAERLNSYFFAGSMVALINIATIVIFNLGDGQARLAEEVPLFPNLVGYGFINGLLSAAGAMVLMYLVTIMFNLPTGLRLVELNQANQPLQQRLLRDAPGTYQHSLQVANLAEQATSAIGGNAELVRVAALYHDVGKTLNAPFFVENQADGVNPHDEMGDPYRSADIIIGHVTEGDKLARQNRLPMRLRDFIREHHGTTRVEYFYQQARTNAEDPDSVDPMDFTYPGPAPQSRETAIMMLADGCESAVRARRPSSKQEIQEIVQGIINARNSSGQLDDSGLTSSDIKTIRSVFVEMLQAVFHPRINYPSPASGKKPVEMTIEPTTTETSASRVTKPKKTSNTNGAGTATGVKPVIETGEVMAAPSAEEETDVSPLPDVPPLPRRSDETQEADDNDDV